MVRLLADRLGCSVAVEERKLLDDIQCGDDDPGLAPLHMAAKNGHANLADILLHNGSNPRMRTARESPLYAATALHLAAQYGHIVSTKTITALSQGPMERGFRTHRLRQGRYQTVLGFQRKLFVTVSIKMFSRKKLL